MIQVSANRKFREKTVSTLEKVSKHRCPGKHLWIFFVTADSVKLRNKDFECPPGVSFNPDEDIWDFQRVLSYLNVHIEDTALIQRVYACLSELISFDLGYVPNQNSYVAQVVNFIAHAAPQSEDRLRGQHKVNFDAKISFNHLESLASRIRDDSTCYPNISSALAELENEGLSPDRYVFNKINRVYHEEISESDGRQSSVKIFFNIVSKITSFVENSPSCSEIPKDCLELSVEYLVVEAFLRCQIFEAPSAEAVRGPHYADA